MEREDPTLAAALERANLVVLVSALAHLTGDRALLSRYPVAKFDRGWNAGSLSKQEKAEIRAHALEILGSQGPASSSPSRATTGSCSRSCSSAPASRSTRPTSR